MSMLEVKCCQIVLPGAALPFYGEFQEEKERRRMHSLKSE